MNKRKIQGCLIGADNVGKAMLDRAIRKVQSLADLSEYAADEPILVNTHPYLKCFSFCTERFEYEYFQYASYQDDLLKGILNENEIGAPSYDVCVFVVDIERGVTDFQRYAIDIIYAAKIPIAAVVLTHCGSEDDELITLAVQEQQMFFESKGIRDIPIIVASPLSVLTQEALESQMQPICKLVAEIDKVSMLLPEPESEPESVPESTAKVKKPRKPKITRMVKNAPPIKPEKIEGEKIEVILYFLNAKEARGKSIRYYNNQRDTLNASIPCNECVGQWRSIAIPVCATLPANRELYQGGEFGKVILELRSRPIDAPLAVGQRFVLESSCDFAWGIISAINKQQFSL